MYMDGGKIMQPDVHVQIVFVKILAIPCKFGSTFGTLFSMQVREQVSWVVLGPRDREPLLYEAFRRNQDSPDCWLDTEKFHKRTKIQAQS